MSEGASSRSCSPSCFSQRHAHNRRCLVNVLWSLLEEVEVDNWLTWILGIAAFVAVIGVVVSPFVTPDLSRQEAENIALERYPGATLLETEMEFEDGRLAYSIELTAEGHELEIMIDPDSGEILAVDSDTDREGGDDDDEDDEDEGDPDEDDGQDDD